MWKINHFCMYSNYMLFETLRKHKETIALFRTIYVSLHMFLPSESKWKPAQTSWLLQNRQWFCGSVLSSVWLRSGNAWNLPGSTQTLQNARWISSCAVGSTGFSIWHSEQYRGRQSFNAQSGVSNVTVRELDTWFLYVFCEVSIYF